MKKKVWMLLLVLAAMFTLLAMSASAAEVVDSGTCGDNLTWELTDDGVLTIRGTGEMEDYWVDETPWTNAEPDSIQSVRIEAGVTSIGDWAFSGCSSLTSITIPDSVTNIDSYAFDGCISLKSVTIPDSVTSIGDWAFSGCSSLTSITIPDSVTNIDYHAFDGCTSLKSVTIPESVTEINFSVFYGCTGLKSVKIPDSVTSISDSAFSGCTSLASIKIPDSVTNIDSHAFEGCTSLTSVTIPDSVTQISSEAFSGCTKLEKITLSKNLYTLHPHAFDGCTALKEITIPGGVKTVSEYAFQNCTALEQATIENGTTEIGNYAFAGCSALNTLTLPDTLETVNVGAFRNCDALKSVYYGGDQNQWKAVSIKSYNDPLKNAAIHYGVATPLEIERDPQNVTTVEGQTAVFTVKASGEIAGYQWQYKTPTGDWKNSTATGCKTATLKISATAERDGYQYRCIVTDQDGATRTSAAAKLTLTAGVVITRSPASSSGEAGRMASFTVCAEGDGLTYQWQYKTSGGSWKNCTAATEGYNKRVLYVDCVTGTTVRDGYQYRCVVTDAYGQTATSAAAKLTVFAIKTQPLNTGVSGSETATFTVKAGGSGLTYQWQFKTPTGSWKNCTAATQGYNTATLTVAGVSGSTNRDGYQYRCVIKDSSGSKITSDAAKLGVVVIKTQPTAKTVSKTGTATFTVKATGSNLTYQWQYKTPTGSWKNCSSATQGYNTATLTVQGASGSTNRDGYQYRCKITCGTKTVTTDAVTLTVK